MGPSEAELALVAAGPIRGAWTWVLLGAAVVAVAYLALVLALLLTGRRGDARALAGFIPDCVVLFRRLLADPAIPRRRKLVVGALVVYLASPIDLIPDFIPALGQLDDALAVVLVLRYVLRGADRNRVRDHWPGPDSSWNLIARAAYGADHRRR